MQVQSNTPMQNPPKNYCPEGAEAWFEIECGHCQGQTMFYFDHTYNNESKIGNAPPTPGQTFVFVHGNPESSYTYQKIIAAMQRSEKCFRVIAMDHIGFGLSDQAQFEMIDMHHAENLSQLIKKLNIQDASLVVHDWGGPIGIGGFVNQPERVRNLMILNSTIFPMPADGLTYDNFPMPTFPWSNTPEHVPDDLWGAVAALVVPNSGRDNPDFIKGLLTNIGAYVSHNFDADSDHYVYSEPMRSEMNARSSQRFVRQTPVWGHGYEYDDERLGHVNNREFYRDIQSLAQPGNWSLENVLGFFGMPDPCGKDTVIAQWQNAFPHMAVEKFPDAGHFVEETHPEEIALKLLDLGAPC